MHKQKPVRVGRRELYHDSFHPVFRQCDSEDGPDAPPDYPERRFYDTSIQARALAENHTEPNSTRRRAIDPGLLGGPLVAPYAEETSARRWLVWPGISPSDYNASDIFRPLLSATQSGKSQHQVRIHIPMKPTFDSEDTLQI
ncbi:hypothetical protein N0V84_010411 [Fusarium piperis]|uniref:Uncharacterized protein n=1 Tax=Fusarium piperis TaxID=1435070 RepID=A0A9W8TCB2_9HYPO|nr:hypothetical protein N0V84_010411 [Fusarium piperis]